MSEMEETADIAKEPETPVTPETEPAEEAPQPEAPKAEAPQAEEPATETPRPEAKKVEPDWKDLYARMKADFDNYKKRALRDREDTYRYAEADILGDVLPAIDNLALALSKAENQEDPFVKGVQLVYDSMLAALKNHGAEPFDSVGETLDPERMEAIATLPSETIEEGKVSNEAKRGWMLKGKVLRPAQVVVSNGRQA
jgi:molecular chaperone GrpE